MVRYCSNLVHVRSFCIKENLWDIVKDVADIVPIIIHFVSVAISHLDHHMAHQFQKGMSAENAERLFSEDIIIALIVPKD